MESKKSAQLKQVVEKIAVHETREKEQGYPLKTSEDFGKY